MKTGVLCTGTLTNKARLLAAYAACNRQVVRALDGTKISEGSFDHVHRFKGGLIAHMDIQKVEAVPR